MNDTECTIKGLQEGKEYEFRVAAVNKAGTGKWSKTDQAIEARAPDCAPKINAGNSTKEITVKAGDTLVIPISYQASPAPKVTWSKGNNELSETASRPLKFEQNNEGALLTAVNATVDDAGTYTCTLSNALGTDKCTINVIVLAKPSQPQGPIEISDIKSDGCTLTWKPPKETGGSPITNYIIEKCDPKRPNEWQKVT